MIKLSHVGTRLIIDTYMTFPFNFLLNDKFMMLSREIILPTVIR